MGRSLHIARAAIVTSCIVFSIPANAQFADPAPANSKSPKANLPASSEPTQSAPTPSVATPSVPTPSTPTPSVPTPSLQTPNLAAPSLVAPNVSTPRQSPAMVSTSEEQMQAQINDLQALVGDLSQRLDSAETMEAVQASPWTGETIPSPLGTYADCPHHCGDTASGSVCNYYHRFNWQEDAYVSVGAGLRTSFLAAQDQAANGTSYSGDQVIDNMRLYFNGRGHKYIGFEVNTDVQNFYLRPFVTDNNALQFRLLDAIAKFGDGGAMNCWVGRMLPPSDRANLSGPFYTNLYDFPFVSNEPAIFGGRQDGATVWGLVSNQALKYSVGLYDGANSIVGGTNPSDSPQFNARLAYNFLDPETGYYNQSTYYGQKDVLAVGAAVIHQNNGIYSATDGPSDFDSWTGDILYDTKLDNGGVLTLSGAYYNYDTNVVTNNANANALDGNAGLLVAGYMMASELRFCNVVGRLRPLVRWQGYDHTFSQASANAAAITKGHDLELQYVISGSNARLSAGWGQRDLANGRDNINLFLLGTQLQF